MLAVKKCLTSRRDVLFMKRGCLGSRKGHTLLTLMLHDWRKQSKKVCGIQLKRKEIFKKRSRMQRTCCLSGTFPGCWDILVLVTNHWGASHRAVRTNPHFKVKYVVMWLILSKLTCKPALLKSCCPSTQDIMSLWCRIIQKLQGQSSQNSLGGWNMGRGRNH